MNIELINNKLKKIFLTRFDIPYDQWNKTNMQTTLLGAPWWFQSRDLVYLYIDIEKAFNLRLDGEVVSNGSFKSFAAIISMIENCCHDTSNIAAMNLN